MSEPTIVISRLDDKELQTSIQKMVQDFNKGLNDMVSSADAKVKEINEKLRGIKYDVGGSTSGSADVGASKQKKAQEDYVESVKKSTAEVKRQGKEQEMTFGQIATALSKAQRTVSEFNTNRASGILPSSEDYKRYEQALARIVEYHDKLRQSALSRADANQWAFAFDAKRVISDMSAVDDRYKKLVADLKTQQAESAKAFNQQMRDAFKMPTTNVDEVWKKIFKLRELLDKGAKSEFISSTQIKNVENLISKLHDMRREMESKAIPQSVANYIKQLAAITSKKDATKAFEQISIMPSNTMDEIKAKGQALVELVKKVKDTPLMSQSNVKLAEKMIGGLTNQYRALKAEKENAAVQPQKSARDSYIAFMQGYKQKAEQIRRLMEEEQKAMQQRRQNVVDDFSKTIEQRKARVKELSEEVTKLYKERPDGYRDTIKQKTEEMNVLKQKIRELSDAQKNLAESPIGASNRYLDLEKEYNRIKNIMIDTTNTQRQSTQETQQQISAEQRRTEEIRKQLAAITSKKDATKAFEQISIMPSNTMDEIKAKGQALVELVKKVKDTPLMSQSNVKLAEKMIGSLANQYRALKEEKEKVANTQTINAAAENTTRRSLEQEKQDLERLKALQEERRQQIIQTGIAAQQQARILRESIGQQMQSADYTKQVDKVKELQNALTEMKNAYKQPIDSSIKKSLEEDIAITQKALDIAKRYNMTVAGLGAVGVGGKAPTDTLAAYSAEAQRLAGIYKNLSTEERSASAGQGLKRKYQELSRTASQVRKELERPINLKDAMKGGESTIDDLAYKIQRLQSYKRGLDFKTQAGEIQEVDNKIKSLNAELNKYLATAKNVQSQNTALGRSWNYMKNRLAFYFTVGASTQFVKNLIEVRSQYEMNERALGILINSAERGTQIFNELSQMALVSPYTLIELSTAAKQLTAYDIAAKDVVDTTRRLADMAAAVGIPIERLTYALGQIKAYGYLNSRDARMFANAGIPLVKQLSDYYTELEGRLVSTADVYDRIKKKAIGYNDVMQVVNHMTDEGGKFFDFQAKMADTLKVRLANLTLAWNNMLNDIGKESQGVLTLGIGALRELFLHWKQFDEALKSAGWALGLIVTLRLFNVLLVKAGANWGILNKEMTGASIAGANAAGIFRTLGGTIASLVKSPMTWWSLLALAVVDVTRAILNANEAQKTFNESVRNGAKDNFENVNKFLEQYQKIRDSLYSAGATGVRKVYADNLQKEVHATSDNKLVPETQVQDVDKNEAKKSWEAIREQIELTTKQSDEYIGRLLTIENMSERVRQGFDILDDIRVVNAALKDIDDDTIEITNDWSKWWNLWTLPDGLIGNLGDVIGSLQDLKKAYGSVTEARRLAGEDVWSKSASEVVRIVDARYLLEEYEDDLAKFREDLKVTTDSIINFIELKGWSGDVGKINAVFEQVTQKLSLENQLDPQKAFTLQVEMEAARSKAAKQAQASRLKDIKSAYDAEMNMYKQMGNTEAGLRHKQAAQDLAIESQKQADIYRNWNQYNGRTRVEWERFTKWLKEQHISETTAMFRDMEANDIKSLNFQEGKHAEWVQRMVTQYAKEHKMSYDEAFDYLKSWVQSANTWSVTIPVMLNVQEQSDFQKEFNRRAKSKYGESINFSTVAPEQNQDLPEWTKKRQESLVKLHTAEKEYARDKTEWGKQQLKDTKAQITLEQQALDLFGQKYVKDTKGNKKDRVLEALKMEIDLVKKLQSDYDKLTKAGASSADALKVVQGAYGKTINLINTKMSALGLPKIDMSIITGKDPNKVLEFFNKVKDTLSIKGLSNVERMKAVEGVIQEFTVSAKTYNLDMITKGLNNELGKLKDEYELAVELDANPELGDMFADMFGINTSMLPRTFGDALDRAQTIINRKLAEMNITTPFDLMEGNIDSFAKSTGLDKDGAVIKELVSAQNAYRNMFKKNITETEKMLDDYIKKYGDYSDKIAEIEADRLEKLKKLNEAYYTEEMRKRPEYIAKLNAIEQGAKKEEQQVDFDEFKNSRYYTMMFENLDYISTKTIRDMRDRVREYIDTAKDLTPEQLKTLISQYEKLEQKVVKRSPFKTLAKDLKEYFSTSKERKAANNEFRNAEKEYNAQSKIVAALNKKYEQAKANTNTSKSYLDFLQIEINGENEILKILKEQLDAAEKKADKYNLTAKLAKSEALQVAQVVGQNLQSLGELRDFLQQDLGIELSDELNGLVDGLSKVGQGINKITSSATSGDVVGVITGVGQTIYGLYDGIASLFGGGSNDKKITKQIQESERAVKRLELAYIDLEHAVNEAYGMATIGANKAAIANKELQLAELKRQLQLEKSRDSKNRDEDKIIDLQKQIKELEYEIKDATDAIVNDLLGISSVGDAMESLMDGFVEALRNGEDAMAVFDESVDNMIANMVKKMFVTKVLQPWFEKQWNTIQKSIDARAANLPNQIADAQNKISNAMSNANAGDYVNALRSFGMSEDEINRLVWYKDNGKFDFGQSGTQERLQKKYEQLLAAWQAIQEGMNKDLVDATAVSSGDIKDFAGLLRSGRPVLEGSMAEISDLLNELVLMKGAGSDNLSALQQGIQGITEDTANSIEAYLNGVSQQVYYHSTLLEQIRDAVVGFDLDVSLGVQSQMLLQLQSSYQTQQAIQQILEGVLVPSGRAFAVELIS